MNHHGGARREPSAGCDTLKPSLLAYWDPELFIWKRMGLTWAPICECHCEYSLREDSKAQGENPKHVSHCHQQAERWSERMNGWKKNLNQGEGGRRMKRREWRVHAGASCMWSSLPHTQGISPGQASLLGFSSKIRCLGCLFISCASQPSPA